MTSAFYLHWISPDQIIYEGEEAYVGCEAVGLEDVSYEWKVSRDGGKTFEDDTLLGNEHVIPGLEANDPDGKKGGKSIPQLGDEQMMGLIALAAAGVFASLILMLALMRPKRQGEEAE